MLKTIEQALLDLRKTLKKEKKISFKKEKELSEKVTEIKALLSELSEVAFETKDETIKQQFVYLDTQYNYLCKKIDIAVTEFNNVEPEEDDHSTDWASE